LQDDGSSDDDGVDDEEALEEAMLQGGKMAQRECIQHLLVMDGTHPGVLV
jgi:hypothetical protein